jgi:EAL domain-containing protein (putative c-di-GMP-specific phosphodiesterase class I)/CheY-like chemotaxis protein
MSRILVIDDDDLMVQSYVRALTRLGHTVESASNGRQGLQRFRESACDAILSDLAMPDMDGIAFLRELRRFDLDVPVLIVTGSPSLESAIKAVEYGAFRYITKPVLPDELGDLLERAVRFHEMARLRRLALNLVEQSGHALGDRASLEARFDSAMATARIAFQPIISWRARLVVGYEALLRTQEPTLLRPDHFIDAASRLGRLPDLGRRARACTAQEVESAPPDATIFVNIHASDLTDDELTSPTAPLSKIAGRVTLEVTERTSLHDAGDLRSRLDALRALGYRLAVDDLGAGYAGLSSLALVDPEVVKIDMSLVRDVDKNAAKQEVIRSMAHLAAGLGMELIVEGVETAAERDTLVTLGCDLMQGFLFARPTFGWVVPDLNS